MAAPAPAPAAAAAAPAPRFCVPAGSFLVCHHCADYAVTELNEISRHYKKAHADHPEWLGKGNTPYHLCRIVPAAVVDALNVAGRKQRPANAAPPRGGYKSPSATVQDMQDLFRLKQIAVPAGLLLTPVNIPANELAVAAPPVPVVAAPVAPVAVLAAPVSPARPAVARSAYNHRFDTRGKRI